jgi:hypothetical protein
MHVSLYVNGIYCLSSTAALSVGMCGFGFFWGGDISVSILYTRLLPLFMPCNSLSDAAQMFVCKDSYDIEGREREREGERFEFKSG